MNVRRHFHSLYFGGKDLADFGVHVSGDGSFGSPERDIETIEVPGKSGDLIIDNGRYKNTEITYEAFILADNPQEFDLYFRSLRGYLMGQRGYKRIEDTYHPEEFRMGYFSGNLDPEVTLLQAATFDLEFTVKPQRFLKSGDITYSYDYDLTLYNPTYNDSNPLIRVYGNGDVYIGGTYRITTNAPASIPYIDIDSEIGDCFYGATNCNGYVTLSGNEFPKLKPGDNALVLNRTSTLTKVDITPRYYEV